MAIERNDLLLMLHIQQEGSLAGAARLLDLAPTVVSKRLSALEADLGVRLLHRTTRRLQFTAEGEAFLQQAAELCAGFERLQETLADKRDDAHGRLRVASSFGFGRVWLAPVLAQLQAAHPGLQIDLHLSAHLPDLGGDGFDAAVWLWRPQSESLVTRRLARNRRIVVAAPAYLARRGVPAEPEDLIEHDCLLVREDLRSPAVWDLQLAARRNAPVRRVRVRGPLSSNHGEVVREWALQGRGLMLRSLWDVHPLLASGALVQVLLPWCMQDADVHLVLPPRGLRLTTPKRVQLLQDHLVAAFADAPWQAGIQTTISAVSARAARSPRPGR